MACLLLFLSDFMKLLDKSIYLCYKSIFLRVSCVLDLAGIASLLEFSHVAFGMNFTVPKPLHDAPR